jgi:hypothetical protein
MPQSSLFNPAGGLRYHLRARRYSKELWQPFRWALGEYLLSWQVSAKTLLLVGPSGGYCMQPFVFERFEQVVCLEPDPLARFIFRRRLARAPLERRPQLEFIAEDHLLGEPARLVRLADSLGDCALLFSNVLGQLRCLLNTDTTTEPRLARIREAVAEATACRAFASFHDRVSGDVRPTFEQPYLSDTRLSDEALLSRLFARHGGRARRTPPSLLCHLTEGFFPPTLPCAYFTWQLEPGQYHLIEAVSSRTGHVASGT